MDKRSECVSQQKARDLDRGRAISSGVFARNLKKKQEISKRYEKDSDETPEFGYKLTQKFWNNAINQNDMSFNLYACVCSNVCSIAVHPHADQYYHVAHFDLTAINQAIPDHSFTCQYDPIDGAPDGPNLCHFELVPLEGSTQSLFALQSLLDNPFPSGRMPDGPVARTAAFEATESYSKLIQIFRWVRSSDGSLS